MPDLVATLRAAGCVFAEEEAAEIRLAAAGDDERLAALTARRVAGEPLEHVVGSVLLDGHRIAIRPGVFIPRQRSVLLVEIAAAALPHRPGLLVDIGCGTGGLGLAVSRRRTESGASVEVWAVDADPVAVACAADNLRAEPRAHALLGDLTDPLPDRLRGLVDVIVANLPYVPSADRARMPAESRLHEPAATTDGGPDGLDHVRRLAGRAADWLRPGGLVVVETGGPRTGQDRRAAEVFAGAGLAAEIRHDVARGATAVIGRR